MESKLAKNCKKHWHKLGITTMDDFKNKVKDILKTEDHQSTAIIEIYRLVFPEWDKITAVNGFPEAGKGLWKFIAGEFIKFDKLHHPNVFSGGIWLNNGFSSNSNLDDWEISFENCSIEY